MSSQLSADAYFKHVVTLLATAAEEIEVYTVLVEEDDLTGVLRAVLRFPGGRRLTVELEFGGPVWTAYAFHFRDEADQCIFRYDNAPHHPGVETFPHHRHSGPQEYL